MWQLLLLLYTGRAVPFESTWTTTTSNETIELPFILASAYDFIVDWGDGVVVPFPSVLAHTYTSPGNHNIRISGTVRGFRFHQSGVSPHKIVDIWRWGDFIVDSTSAGAFLNCDNLRVSASDQPIMMPGADLSMFFMNCSTLNFALSWDCSNVVNMHSMFRSASNFDSPINFVNTLGVTDLSFMFAHAQRFNRPLSLDTRNVRSIAAMFWQAAKFNSHLSFTTTFKIVNMSLVFCEAVRFNQPLNWDTSNVLNMNSMFRQASNFNQILRFSTGRVTNMEAMFHQAFAFNKPENVDTQRGLRDWNVSAVTTCARFCDCCRMPLFMDQCFPCPNHALAIEPDGEKGFTCARCVSKGPRCVVPNLPTVCYVDDQFWTPVVGPAVGDVNGDDDLTGEACALLCANNGWTLAALKNGSQCYCGDKLRSDLVEVDVSECNSPCAGHPEEFCGGVGRATVFAVNCSIPPVTRPQPTDVIGCVIADIEACYKEGDPKFQPWETTDTTAYPSPGGMLIAGSINGDNWVSPEFCALMCLRYGHQWAASSDGIECFCSHDVAQITDLIFPSFYCTSPCKNGKGLCGSSWIAKDAAQLSWRVNVYKVDCSASPCPPNYVGSPGLCRCAEGFRGKVVYVNKVATGCVAIPPYTPVAGIVVGCVSLLLIICFLLVWLIKRKRRRRLQISPDLALSLAIPLASISPHTPSPHAPHTPHSNAFVLSCDKKSNDHYTLADSIKKHLSTKQNEKAETCGENVVSVKKVEEDEHGVGPVESIDDVVANGTNRRTQFAREISEFCHDNRRYRVKKILGQGKFGVAFLVCDSKEAEFVVKVQPCFHHDGPLHEANLMAKLPKSPHLLSLLEYFYHDNSDYFCLVLDYCSGGTLAAQVSLQLSPGEVWRILKELCTGLATLHAADIVHRDVKPDNIFLRDAANRSVVLGDMGLARFTVDGYYDSTYGHKLFKAPEIQHGKFSSRSDMWAVGCVGLELLTGVSMSQRWETSKIIFGQLTQEEVDHEVRLGVPVFRGRFQEVFSVVSSLLRVAPQERLSAIQVSEGVIQLPG